MIVFAELETRELTKQLIHRRVNEMTDVPFLNKSLVLFHYLKNVIQQHVSKICQNKDIDNYLAYIHHLVSFRVSSVKDRDASSMVSGGVCSGFRIREM